jgi:hypothetical protein
MELWWAKPMDDLSVLWLEEWLESNSDLLLVLTTDLLLASWKDK